MAKLDQSKLEEAILTFAGFKEGVSYGALCALYAMESATLGGSVASIEKAKMQIGRTLQKLRRAKKIYMVRVNRHIFWHATTEVELVNLPSSQTAANG